MTWTRLWHKHPGVRTGEQLTLGERAADILRKGMGSWTFVFLFLVFMAVWAIGNSVFYLGVKHGQHGFDPYPYILLNLMLSTMAGLQAAALLIAEKRVDQIASEIAVHTEGNADDIKTLLKQNTDLTEAIQALTKEVHEKIFAEARRVLLFVWPLRSGRDRRWRVRRTRSPQRAEESPRRRRAGHEDARDPVLAG